MKLSKRNIIFLLIIIGSISLFFKLYTIELSLPFASDNLNYTLDAIQYSQGNFFVTAKKNPGWPLLASPFMLLLDSDNFLDYTNLVRALSLGIGTLSIFPMYMLGRRFFNEKYSLVATALFAFEPHLNYISGQGLSEPLFILLFISSIYFVLDKNPKKVIISFIIAGFFWWIRIEGFYLFFIITIIFLLSCRKSSKLILQYSACVAVFLIIVSPLLLQRYEQFGDPFFVWYDETIFSESYSVLLTSPNESPFDYIGKYGVTSFFDRFIITGIDNMIDQLSRIMFPFLFILLPFGILFSFRAFDQNQLFIRANWVVILITLAVLVIPFSTIGDRRFLFPIFPFLIIFATIPIQRVTEYGLGTFSFTNKKKSAFLIIVIFFVVVLSTTFTFGYDNIGYGKLDVQKEHEKIEFARILVNTLEGRMIDSYETMEYVTFIQISESSQTFKNYKRTIDKNPYRPPDDPTVLARINIHTNSIEELILKGENLDLKYIAIDEEEAYFLPFLNHIYKNEENYPYLIKILDSSNMGFKKYKVKVFEIDYKKFHELNK